MDGARVSLADNGVGFRSRVAIILPNAPETAIAILATASCATAIPVNPAYPPDEMKRMLASAGVTHVLVQNETGFVVPVAAELGIPTMRLARSETGPTGAFGIDPAPVAPDAPAESPATMQRTALVLHTSGSTGSPKRVPLTAEQLNLSAWNVARSLELSDADMCLNMMPMFHIGALVDLLLAPLYAGGSVAFAEEISVEAFFRGLRDFRPTWSQAVPTVLRDLLAWQAGGRGEDQLVGNLRFIRAVSQPLPPKLQAEFEAVFGTLLVPIYGMTETAGLIASTPLGRGRRKPGSVGAPIGTRVKICDAFGNEMRPGHRGEVLIGGPTVMAGYEGSDVARSATFRGDWLRSGDEGYLDEDGHLFLSGRTKDVINRGGEKIAPVEIDQILSEHPAIREAAAFPVFHPTLGEDVAAAVALKDGCIVDAGEIRNFLRGRIADFKIPRAVIFLERLPRLPSGKLDRLALPGLAGQSSDPRSRTPPDTALAKMLATMWRKVLRVSDVAMEDDFFELGGDSLSAVSFATMLEERLGRDVPTNLLFDQPTLRGMTEALMHGAGGTWTPANLDARIHAAVRKVTAAWRGARPSEGSLLVGRNTLGSKRPFFWVSQTMHGFEALAECFDPDRPLYAMTSLSQTGLKTDENTRRLARYYAEEILAIQPNGPLLIGGFCQGGVVAFEMARWLRSIGSDVALLCLQDRFVAEPYDGDVAFFWGKRGWFSAYYLNDEPERAWAKYYSGSISVSLSDADHDDLHNVPYIRQFALQLEGELERVETGGTPPYRRAVAPLSPLDPRGFRSRIRARVPRFMRQGSEHSIKVRVRNTSPVTWEPTERSGIILASRWIVSDPVHHFVLDGRLPIPDAIPPGGHASFDLPIRVPMHRLPVRLEIDLVEDGVHWFGGVGRSGTRKLVFPTSPK